MVSTGMGCHFHAGKLSRYVTSCTGQLGRCWPP